MREARRGAAPIAGNRQNPGLKFALLVPMAQMPQHATRKSPARRPRHPGGVPTSACKGPGRDCGTGPQVRPWRIARLSGSAAPDSVARPSRQHLTCVYRYPIPARQRPGFKAKSQSRQVGRANLLEVATAAPSAGALQRFVRTRHCNLAGKGWKRRAQSRNRATDQRQGAGRRVRVACAPAVVPWHWRGAATLGSKRRSRTPQRLHRDRPGALAWRCNARLKAAEPHSTAAAPRQTGGTGVALQRSAQSGGAALHSGCARQTGGALAWRCNARLKAAEPHSTAAAPRQILRAAFFMSG